MKATVLIANPVLCNILHINFPYNGPAFKAAGEQKLDRRIKKSGSMDLNTNCITIYNRNPVAATKDAAILITLPAKHSPFTHFVQIHIKNKTTYIITEI
jgi:hypothetical protein